MQWIPCNASSHDTNVTIARFGHSTVCISGSGSVWGTDLAVVFGGVSYSDGEQASTDHHAALSDIVVLQAEADTWFSPQVSAGVRAPGVGYWAGRMPARVACTGLALSCWHVQGNHILVL